MSIYSIALFYFFLQGLLLVLSELLSSALTNLFKVGSIRQQILLLSNKAMIALLRYNYWGKNSFFSFFTLMRSLISHYAMLKLIDHKRVLQLLKWVEVWITMSSIYVLNMLLFANIRFLCKVSKQLTSYNWFTSNTWFY